MKKLAAWILLAVMLTAATSCSGGSGETAAAEDNVPKTELTAENTEEETEAVQIQPDLPEKDYEGYTFTIYSKGSDHPHWVAKDVYAAEETGDPIVDAVFQRNLMIEEKYNVKIAEETSNQWIPNITNSVNAGDDVYDLIELHLFGVINTLAQNGLLLDLNTIPYMDLSKPWYDQNANASLSIGGKLYATTGDISIMDNDATWVVLFNKELANDYSIGDMYELVNSGKWTLDELIRLCGVASMDLDGDGDMDEYDQWGIQNEPYNAIGFCMAAGERLIDKDADDLPFISIGSEQFVTIYQKSVEFLTNKEICMNYADYVNKYPGADPWTKCMDPAFSEGRVLFNVTGLNRVTMFRAMDDNFGILPIPKYEESAENYICPVHMWCCNSISVLKSASDPERTGIIVEAMSADSMYRLTPAYYDVSLKTKFSRDNESAEMLDLIFASRAYDLGAMYNWGNIYQFTLDLVTAGNENFASEYARINKRVQTEIDRFIENLE